MKVEETIIQKIKKIKALADQGIQGEAANAKELLCSLLEKYNLEYDEIFNEEDRKNYGFKYSSKDEELLFFSCIANVFGSDSEAFKTCFHYKNGTMVNYLKLTTFEYAIFSDFYDFHRTYWKDYIKNQSSLLMKAYIQSQNLFDISPKKDKPARSRSEISMKDMRAIFALSEQMKDHVPQYRKSLNE